MLTPKKFAPKKRYVVTRTTEPIVGQGHQAQAFSVEIEIKGKKGWP